MELEQGYMSYVERKNGRLYKSINYFNAYNEPVGPYEECKMLKYISKLGSEFPQNVKCEGSHGLSYDYIPGITLKKYVDINYPIPISKQKDIIYQIINGYYKLFKVGFYHGDPGLKNFLIDNIGNIHIIDFGLAYSPYRKVISPPIIHKPNFDESSEDSDEDLYEPEEEYFDIDIISNELGFTNLILGLLEELFNTELLDESLYELLIDNIDDKNKLELILS